LVEDICPSHDFLMLIIFPGSLGASYKTFVILNSGNLNFLSFFVDTLKKKVKLFLVFLTMIIIIAAVYGNEFITRTKTTKKK
jgi:hypothetical protein